MHRRIPLSVFFSILFSFPLLVTAQKKNGKDPVYIDRSGVLRWSATGKEASFFGVNYTTPFAYGYRSHKTVGADLERSIDADVYHLSRLGLDAFRVHMWDVEISDSLGNLLNNEHLRLFDYLLKKLKEKHIKILLTPIAFWGNGYPDRDEKTPGFSTVYGKGNAVVLEAPIRAQENYLKQIFLHVNPYTGLSYRDDPDIIAAEINNEPHHSGPKEKTTEYINRLASAIRSTGWTKPVFYNISESPSYADAVVHSTADGYSFQWYPTGLVAGHEQKGNFLPNVDQYRIPFGDTIRGFAKKPRMVYEFDAGDVLQPVMYPAMARSFRTAGFQWATQFAYDPMATAFANTEYQTHYLNLVYTPEKAISLLIASEVFHRVPLGKSYGTYPRDTSFDVFRISYREGLSEMNAQERFYYTTNTQTKPVSPEKLQHVAGVGNSPVIKYSGSGAYFLDRVAKGIWRLEVMPDIITMYDPFTRTSLNRPVRKVIYHWQKMKVSLKELGPSFRIHAINNGNSYPDTMAAAEAFKVNPGVYLLRAEGAKLPAADSLGLNREFYAPASNPQSIDEVMNAPMHEYNVYFDQSWFPDRTILYNPNWRKNWLGIAASGKDSAKALRLSMKDPEPGKFIAFESYAGRKVLQGAVTEIVIKGRADTAMNAKLVLITASGQAWSAPFMLVNQVANNSIPFSLFLPDSLLLLPRPYPGFQPMWFQGNHATALDPADVERIQIFMEPFLNPEPGKTYSMDIHSVRIK
jgi:hypothetical protein